MCNQIKFMFFFFFFFFLSLFTFTGVITMCLARGEVLHERRWDFEGCLSPQRRQVQELLMVYHERVQHQRWCRPLLYQSPILRLEWAGRWRGVGSRGSSIHLGSAEVEKWNWDVLRHPIAALSEEVLRRGRTERKLMNRIRAGQMSFLGHIMRKHRLENIVDTGKIEGERSRGRPRLNFMKSLSQLLKSVKSRSSKEQETGKSGEPWPPTSELDTAPRERVATI